KSLKAIGKNQAFYRASLILFRGSTTSAPRMIKSYILNFLLGFWFGVACLRLYEQQGFLDIVTNLQDLEKSFLEFSRFLLPI
ncbi:hypothetical protein, partial [Parasutterella sp.]|uniref:hypothetical protein n=1 Tax=Parasutterella sp. TaxID=2049037 RepID=UPI0039955F82